MSTVHLELESPAGNVDLSSYLNVQEGQGMDPADPAFSNRVFAHSLLKRGGVLALEDLKLREMTFPLTLKATSKDKLTALVRELNTILETPGCEVEWSDEGTAVSTFFDLASGQFDPEFDFRQGQQSNPMLKGKLRLFVQPLGQIEKLPRKLLMAGTSAANGATLTASVPVAVFHAASGLRGDAPGQLSAVLQIPSEAYFAAFSVLPTASYQPFLTASSSSTVAFGNWKASSSAADGIINTGGNGFANRLLFTLPNETYVGQNRVLALARRVNAATDVKIGIEMEGIGREASLIAASDSTRNVDVASTSWIVADCGVITRGSLPASAWNLVLTSTGTVALAGVIVLPDNTTSWLREPFTTPEQTSITFSGVNGSIEESIVGGLPGDRSGYARGAIPTIPPGATPAALAFMAFNYLTLTTKKAYYVNVLETSRYVF